MSIDLSNLQTSGQTPKPARLQIYGPPGLGKSSLAADFPSPILCDIEDGAPEGVAIPTLPDEMRSSFAGIMEGLKQLYLQDHNFSTLIIDSVDRLEPLIWQYACEKNGWNSIEDPGFGKGYLIALDHWQRFINACNSLRRDKGMTIIYIAHSTIGRFDDPLTESYSKFDTRLHKRANDLLQDEVDAILFINQDVATKTTEQGFGKERTRAEGAGVRWIYTEMRPSFVAKNRYGMPARLKYDKGKGFDVLSQYLPVAEKAEPKPKTKTKKEAA